MAPSPWPVSQSLLPGSFSITWCCRLLLGIQPKEFNSCLIIPENLYLLALRVLEELANSSYVLIYPLLRSIFRLTTIKTWLMEYHRDSCLSSTSSHLCKWTLGGSKLLPFHNDEAHNSPGDFPCSTNRFIPFPRSVPAHISISELNKEFLGLVIALWIIRPYTDRCVAFQNHVQSVKCAATTMAALMKAAAAETRWFYLPWKFPYFTTKGWWTGFLFLTLWQHRCSNVNVRLFSQLNLLHVDYSHILDRRHLSSTWSVTNGLNTHSMYMWYF